MEPVYTQPSQSIAVLQKKVLLIMPWQKNTNPMTAFCMMQLADKRRTSSMLNFGDAFVAHTRNTCADLFLESGMEWALWVDDDMVVPFGSSKWFRAHTGWENYPDPFASFNAIDRLLSHGKTLVGALYFGRHFGGPGVFNEGALNHPGLALAKKAPFDEIRPTRWVGTGCMLTHRSVFEDIERKFPLLARGPNKRGGQWFTSSEHTALDWIERTRKFLTDGPMDGLKAAKAHEMLERASAEARGNSSLGMGEDVTLCIRAKEAGHQPYVDFGLVCGHIGHCVFGANTAGK